MVEDRIERKIKRLNALRAEYEDSIKELQKRLKEDEGSKDRYERLIMLNQSKVDKLIAQVKELRQKRERMG